MAKIEANNKGNKILIRAIKQLNQKKKIKIRNISIKESENYFNKMYINDNTRPE